MNNFVGLKEFRNNVKDWIDYINQGRSIVVLRRSKPVFKISPVSDDLWEEVIDFTKIKKGGVNVKELLTRL